MFNHGMTSRDICGTAAIFGDVSWKEEGREKNEDKEVMCSTGEGCDRVYPEARYTFVT